MCAEDLQHPRVYHTSRVLPPQEQLRPQPPPCALSALARLCSAPQNGLTCSPSEDTALPPNTGHGWPYQGETGTPPALTPNHRLIRHNCPESERESICIWSDSKWDEGDSMTRGNAPFSSLIHDTRVFYYSDTYTYRPLVMLCFWKRVPIWALGIIYEALGCQIYIYIKKKI